jgi:hypothetical protein
MGVEPRLLLRRALLDRGPTGNSVAAFDDDDPAKSPRSLIDLSYKLLCFRSLLCCLMGVEPRLLLRRALLDRGPTGNSVAAFDDDDPSKSPRAYDPSKSPRSKLLCFRAGLYCRSSAGFGADTDAGAVLGARSSRLLTASWYKWYTLFCLRADFLGFRSSGRSGAGIATALFAES